MINTITKLRLPDGTEVGFVDWQDMPLYSTIDLLSAFNDLELNLFTYVVGDQVPGSGNITVNRTATERDTNVQVAGSLASTEEMLIFSIQPEYMQLRTADGTPTDASSAVPAGDFGLPTATGQNLAEFHRLLILSLITSQKVEHSAPLGYYNTGFGATSGWGFMDEDVAPTLRSYGTAGVPSQAAVRSVAVPVYIGGQEKYRVALTNPRGVAVNFRDEVNNAVLTQSLYQIRVLLNGLLKRPVS